MKKRFYPKRRRVNVLVNTSEMPSSYNKALGKDFWGRWQTEMLNQTGYIPSEISTTWLGAKTRITFLKWERVPLNNAHLAHLKMEEATPADFERWAELRRENKIK